MVQQSAGGLPRVRGVLVGEDYPFEPFVRRALEAYFAHEGYEVSPSGSTGLVARHESTEQRWIIEVLGKGKKPRADWGLGLSDLLMAMQEEDPAVSYALAIPATRNFLEKRGRVAAWVRRALRMHWLVVQADGSVRVIEP